MECPDPLVRELEASGVLRLNRTVLAFAFAFSIITQVNLNDGTMLDQILRA